MRLGAPVFAKWDSPEQWIAALRALGYRGAFCPVGTDAAPDTVAAYARAAAAADIVIGEVGAWSNPLSPDDDIRKAAMETCTSGLDLADRIGARCCVNIAGSVGPKWDGPDPRDLTDDTFDAIVESVREIIDAVAPTRTFYSLETMPWMFPDSAETYLQLIAAIDRPAFAVHFDPVNLVNSPARCFGNAALIRDFIRKLGPRIRSCHAKDIRLDTRLTVHLDECRPGTGTLDYGAFLGAVAALDPDVTVLVEHLPDAGEYDLAVDHIRKAAVAAGLVL